MSLYATEESPASRCLDLVFNHAPRLMRCGGGPISESRRKAVMPVVSESEIAEFVRLKAEGHSFCEIGRRTGRDRTSVIKYIRIHENNPQK